MARWTRYKTGQELKKARPNRRRIAVNVDDVDRTIDAMRVLQKSGKKSLDELADKFGAAAYQHSPKGRVQRKPSERARPDLPADAPVNRIRKQIGLTLPPDLVEQVRDKCAELGVDRTAFIEYALRQMLKPD